MPEDAESSSQALERYLRQQLDDLKLEVPQDDMEMMARFIEEEGLERDEKIEGVQAMLEGLVEVRLLGFIHWVLRISTDSQTLPDGVNDKLGTVVDEWDRLKALEAEAESSSDSSSDDEDARTRAKNVLESMTPEEKAAAQKAALLRQYAYVDADPENLAMMGLSLDGRDPNAPPPRSSAGSKAEEKAAEERRKAIEEALKLDGKKKKHRKNREGESMCYRCRGKEDWLIKACSGSACTQSQPRQDGIYGKNGARSAKEYCAAAEGSGQGCAG